jgi:hypothetical protein
LRYDKDFWQQFGQDQPGLKGGIPFPLRHAMEGVLAGILDHQRLQEGAPHGQG